MSPPLSPRTPARTPLLSSVWAKTAAALAFWAVPEPVASALTLKASLSAPMIAAPVIVIRPSFGGSSRANSNASSPFAFKATFPSRMLFSIFRAPSEKAPPPSAPSPAVLFPLTVLFVTVRFPPE